PCSASKPTCATTTGTTSSSKRRSASSRTTSRRRLLCLLRLRLDDPAEAQRPQHDQDRAEAQHDVDDAERDAHADAEAQERRLAELAAEQVEQEALFGPDPAGADRQDRREALANLDEQCIVGGRRDAE